MYKLTSGRRVGLPSLPSEEFCGLFNGLGGFLASLLHLSKCAACCIRLVVNNMFSIYYSSATFHTLSTSDAKRVMSGRMHRAQRVCSEQALRCAAVMSGVTTCSVAKQSWYCCCTRYQSAQLSLSTTSSAWLANKLNSARPRRSSSACVQRSLPRRMSLNN